MTEPALAIADDVVTQLNAQFDGVFVAVREYLVEKDFIFSDTLTATVMPVDLDSEMSTRQEDQESHRIGIALHKKVTSTGKATIDPLTNIVRQVHDFCRAKTFGQATVIKRRTTPYDYKHLKKKEFVGYVELECQLFYIPEEE